MSDGLSDFYEFGPFRVDVRRRLLDREENPIALTPKAFETLLALLQSGGRLLKKEELLSQIWPDTFVEESNLAQNIFLLRKALGEGKNEHLYIVTVPGVGYRFVAAVTTSDGPPAAADRAAAPARASVSVDSLAVLPFKALAGAEDDKFMGLGLADALIMRLSSLRNLSVRPTTAVLNYGEAGDLLRIGRELNVDALLDGLYQRDGGQIRVSVQLVRVSDGMTLWAAKFDQSFTNIFAIQDSISEQVTQTLELKLTGEERRRLRKSYTDSPEAFHLYIKGRYFWNKRTPDGVRKALEYAQQAIAVDPTYAPAYVGLADSFNLLGAQHGVLPPRDAFPKARVAATRALEIDDTFAEAYSSLGFLTCCYDWDWPAAEGLFRKALDLKPNYPTAAHWYGELLVTAGRFEEGVALLRRALELDPLSAPISTDLAACLYYARQYEASAEQLHKTLEIDSTFLRAHIISGAIHERLGEFEQAVAVLRRACEVSGNDPVILSSLAHALAAGGRAGEARELLGMLLRLSEHRYIPPCNVAVIHIGLDEKESAFEWLEKAYAERDMQLVWLLVNPRFDPLRGDERFDELLGRVGFPRPTRA